MKKRTLSKLLMGIGLVFSISFSSGCESEQILTIEQITDIGGAGSFLVINVSTQDTIKVEEGLYIGMSYPTLTAKNGDEIRLTFTPVDKYNKYNFNVIYTLPDSTDVAGKGKDYSYNFVLNGIEPENYSVSMSAGSTEQIITSFGKVTLKVTE